MKLFPNQQGGAATALAMMMGLLLGLYLPEGDTWSGALLALLSPVVPTLIVWFIISNCWPDEYATAYVWVLRSTDGDFIMVFRTYNSAYDWAEATINFRYTITEERVFR